MNVVDSSGWLEYFADGPNADFFAPAIKNKAELIVPTISIYEVFKCVLRERSEKEALQVAVMMQQGIVSDLDVTLALSGAKLSLELQLPMADAVILATAQAYRADLWTQDADFKGIPGVQCIDKRNGAR